MLLCMGDLESLVSLSGRPQEDGHQAQNEACGCWRTVCLGYVTGAEHQQRYSNIPLVTMEQEQGQTKAQHLNQKEKLSASVPPAPSTDHT